ncbi:MAG: hypothetical protein ACQEVQ_03415 [Pseudomonadota bacterium]
MDIVFTVIVGLIAMGFVAMWIQFALTRPLTVISMLVLALLVSSNDNYAGTALTLIILSWLFTTKTGLIHVGGFFIGFFLAYRQK